MQAIIMMVKVCLGNDKCLFRRRVEGTGAMEWCYNTNVLLIWCSWLQLCKAAIRAAL
jgi:hypothetical protein